MLIRQPPRAGAVESSADPLVEVPALDGFRAWAALLIVTYHCWVSAFSPAFAITELQSLLASGYVALPFFFVISGFVLFLPTCRNGGDFGSKRAYAIKRVARIVPAYYVALVAVILLWPFVMARYLPNTPWPLTSLDSLWMLFAHLGFLHHEILGFRTVAGFDPGDGFSYDTVIWSLSVEAVFYLVLPFIAVAFFRRPFVLLGFAFALELAWRALSVRPSDVAEWVGVGPLSPETLAWLPEQLITQFPAFVGQIALGMVSAWVYVKVLRSGVDARRRTLIASAVQVCAGVLLLLAMHSAGKVVFLGPWLNPYTLDPRDELPAIVFAVFLVATALAARPLAWLWTNAIARWIGVISYGIFLWHLIVLKLLNVHFAFGATSLRAFLGLLAATIPLSLLAGWLSYRFVELPAMRYARGLARRVSDGERVGEPVPSAAA